MDIILKEYSNMKRTPDERRWHIYKLAEQDEKYRTIKKEYDAGKVWFEKVTNKLPRKLSNKLWVYPGMGYFMHHRMLTLICENMKFIDEE